MNARERRRLSDLLARWTVTDDPPLTGKDETAIVRLRYLLAEADERSETAKDRTKQVETDDNKTTEV